MTSAPPPVVLVGLDPGLLDDLTALARDAGRDLDLGRDFSALRIIADDLPDAAGAWFRLVPVPETGSLPGLILFCPAESFGPRGKYSDSVMPPRPVWEQNSAPGYVSSAPMEFSRERAGIFLYHHLLTARDLVRGEVGGRNLPGPLTEAFTEAWAVVVDGRLSRRGLPGFPLDERRGSFARIFSPAGILLPDHWQVFQSLWDGALDNQKDVLGVVKRLPGL